MADVLEKTDDGAEKAYAAAVAAVKAGKTPEPETADSAVPASEVAPVAEAPAKAAKTPVAVKKAAEPKPAAKPVGAKAASKPAAAKSAVAKPKARRVAKARPAPAAKVPVAKTPAAKAPAGAALTKQIVTSAKPTITELKEKIMATAKTTDFSKPITEAVDELQARAKAAYDKGTEAVSEATDFAKGNVEALVESGKIFSTGVQDLGKTYVDEAKSAYETLTADFKELAGVKSPTELFQLQGKIARRNFDAFVAASAKNSEAMLKLTNEAFAPISSRVNLAAEKISKAA